MNNFCIPSIRRRFKHNDWSKTARTHTHTQCRAAERNNSLPCLFVTDRLISTSGRCCESQEWKLVFVWGLTEGESASLECQVQTWSGCCVVSAWSLIPPQWTQRITAQEIINQEDKNRCLIEETWSQSGRRLNVVQIRRKNKPLNTIKALHNTQLQAAFLGESCCLWCTLLALMKLKDVNILYWLDLTLWLAADLS